MAEPNSKITSPPFLDETGQRIVDALANIAAGESTDKRAADAANSATESAKSAVLAKQSADDAEQSNQSAVTQANNAKDSAIASANSAKASSNSASAASSSASSAANSEKKAKEYSDILASVGLSVIDGTVCQTYSEG